MADRRHGERSEYAKRRCSSRLALAIDVCGVSSQRISKKRFKPITSKHLFDVGSVTKSITAAAVLHLCAEKGIPLDAPLTNFFDDLPEQAEGVSLKHLLGHTASLPKAVTLSEAADGNGAPEHGLWAQARNLKPFVTKPAPNAPTLVFGLRDEEGEASLALQMDREHLAPFVQALREALPPK